MIVARIFRKLGYALVGASITYSIMRHEPVPQESLPQESAHTERVLVPVEVPAPKAIDATRLQSVFDSSDRMRTHCGEVHHGNGVAVVGPSWRVVSQTYVDTMLEEQADLHSHTRIVPVQNEGVVSGVKLYGVRATSHLSELGFENGDELRDIDGYDMTSPDHALEAYAHAHNADVVSVGLVRRGAALRLYYVIC